MRVLFIIFFFIIPFQLNAQIVDLNNIDTNSANIIHLIPNKNFSSSSIIDHLYDSVSIWYKSLPLIEDSITWSGTGHTISYIGNDTIVMNAVGDIVTIGQTIRFNEGIVYNVLDTVGSSDTLVLNTDCIDNVGDQLYLARKKRIHDYGFSGIDAYQATTANACFVKWFGTDSIGYWADGVNDQYTYSASPARIQWDNYDSLTIIFFGKVTNKGSSFLNLLYTSNVGSGYMVTFRSGKTDAYIYNGSSDIHEQWTTSNFEDNKNHMLIATYNQKSIELYKDTILQGNKYYNVSNYGKPTGYSQIFLNGSASSRYAGDWYDFIILRNHIPDADEIKQWYTYFTTRQYTAELHLYWDTDTYFASKTRIY